MFYIVIFLSMEITIGTTPAYLALPAEIGAGIVLIHEVWGLDAHIRQVADRFAAEGYLVVAPNLFSGNQITATVNPELFQRASNPATRDAAQVELRKALTPISSPEFSDVTVKRLKHCYEFLVSHASSSGIVAVVGFCFGGTYTYTLTTEEPNVACAIAFYGHAEGIMGKLDTVKTPILAFYGEQDRSLTEALPTLETEMTKHDVVFSYKVYPNTGHAFFNDTNPLTFNALAAADSWEKSLAFLKEHTNGSDAA